MTDETAKVREKYGHLTVRELMQLYIGPNALPCPEELRPWIDCFITLAEIIEIEDEVRELKRQNRERWS